MPDALEGETVLLEPMDEYQRFFDIYFLDFHIGTIPVLHGRVPRFPEATGSFRNRRI